MFITFKTFIKENDINPLVIDTNKHSSEITKFSCIFSKDSYEVGNVIKIALGQYANIVSSESKTTKFILSMTLLEFLADPFKYLKMQDVKKNLIPLITTNKNEAEYISNHFKFLTSLEDENGCQKGLRTNIIHMGKSIEDLVPNLSDIDFILRTLQKYICKVLENYYSIYDKGWNEVSNLIQSKKQNYSDLPYNVDNEISDTVILIDMKFLNIAIKEVHSLYNELKLTKNNALYFY
ncbi:MAG: hypothetical protein MJH09_12330 [Cetobacterium sp.]|nr:hypothetical protein [Cetobacterium sp.]